MRLGIIFVATLAVSVVLSATATWGLTFSTSYSELQDMSRGFVALATAAVDDFAGLVRQLITDSGDLVSNILETEFQRSVAQMNDTQYQFLQTSMDLMVQARNTTAQAQQSVMVLLASFGWFIQSILTDFQAVGSGFAYRIRAESASQAQASFKNMLQGRIFSLQRQAQLYEWGLLNLNVSKDQPPNADSCTLLGVLCSASKEVQRNVYIGTNQGSMLFCDVTGVAFIMEVQRGATSDTTLYPLWSPYVSGDAAQWRAACVAGSANNLETDICPHGEGMDYLAACNGTCGYDPRCRPWYSVHLGGGVAQTQMSPVYLDFLSHRATVTLSYPIFSSAPRRLVAVMATDFIFSDVDQFLRTIDAGGASQVVAVVLLDLTVVGTSRDCPPNATALASGVPIAEVCDPALQLLGGWLAAHTGMQANATLELNGTLWDVFPATVDAISYFVAVGMNKSEVYSVVDAANAMARRTLSALSQQQAAQMAASEAAALAQMDALSAAKVAGIKAAQAAMQLQQAALHDQAEQMFNASRQKSAANLRTLISGEMAAIQKLEDYHLSKVVNNIGTTFGAVVGIFVAILLGGGYGTWIVTKQVQNITETMEDVADMKVEQLQVSEKSSIHEVQRIETALGILVQRLAEYKSYMPAGLFLQQQQQQEPPEPPQPQDVREEEGSRGPASPAGKSIRASRTMLALPSLRKSVNSVGSGSTCRPGPVRNTPAGAGTRLARRSVAVLAVNLVRFQAELGQLSAGQLEAALNRYISAVHRAASKAQGNIDAILGDQVLVTFNAHFNASDPPVTAAHVALELVATLKEDITLPGRVQIGLATGSMLVGHLGYSQFKAMLALGAPMKVASLLAHLSDFDSHAVLVCPSVAERIQYHFTLQPVDLLSLPHLGEHVALYHKSIIVSTIGAEASAGRGSQEWLYEVNGNETNDPSQQWTEVFRHLAKAPGPARAREELEQYLHAHPDDRLARRLLHRLARWHPRGGIVLAERPDGLHDSSPDSPSGLSLTVACIE